MGSYTKIALSEAQQILNLYGLSGLQELTPLSLGISNSNYKLELAGQNLLLKISNDKGIEQLKQEQDLLAKLAAEKFPFSLSPLKTLDGNLVYQWENYFGVIYPFIEGIPPGPADKTCFEIGAGLAALHLVKTPEGIRRQEEVGFGPAEIKYFVDQDYCPDDFKEIFLQVFPDQLESFRKAPLPSGVIHGDLYYDNTLFQHDHLAVILDFEQAGVGEFLLDLGISISGTCLEKGRVILPLIDSYMRGYESKRPLSPLEKEFFNEAICLGLFSISLWRIHRFTLGQLNPLMSDSYKELLYRALSFKETLKYQESEGNRF